jgi:hypothetical protein
LDIRVAAAGYAGLIVANSLIDSDLSISDSKHSLVPPPFSRRGCVEESHKLTLRVGKNIILKFSNPGDNKLIKSYCIHK